MYFCDVLLRALSILAVGIPVATALFFYEWSNGASSSLILLLTVAEVSLFASVYVIYRNKMILSHLHDRILDAQEGTLSTLDDSLSSDSLTNNLINDYNNMIANLRAMFATVEECQNRVVNERNKMDALYGSMPGALLAVDDNLLVININPQAEELFKSPQEQLLGKMLFDLLNLKIEHRDALRDAFLYKQPVKNYVINTKIADAELYISINIAFHSKHEANVDAVITLQDITDYQRLLDSVYSREKLVAMGQLAAGIAHELNTPLGNILGYSQLISSPKIDDEKRARYVGFVIEETRRCSRIVSDLLSYARRDSCNSENCDVNNLVRDLVDTFITCRLKYQGTDIHLVLSESLPQVVIPCGELDIALSNLLLNALHELEGRENGKITITTRAVGMRHVEVSVSDNGPGIAVENRRRIFEPFFSTKEAGDGTGLGLSISHAMLNRRGADLKLDGEYSEGARFIMTMRGAVENE
ncbi:MAG: PAS domain-containing protein [Gammaproteobacteria bacterium]|nr:PAS domain-containing protein [Gammaproteobacteria bacterium]